MTVFVKLFSIPMNLPEIQIFTVGAAFAHVLNTLLSCGFDGGRLSFDNTALEALDYKGTSNTTQLPTKISCPLPGFLLSLPCFLPISVSLPSTLAQPQRWRRNGSIIVSLM